MTIYQNEEEQIAAIKQWWKENGTSIVIGVSLGFAAIFGWQGWQSYRLAQGEAASGLYVGMQNQAAAGDVEGALAIEKRLLGEHTNSIYASFAALKLAQLMYDRGDKAAAAENLHWVVSHAPDEVVADLARVRLTRVQIDLKNFDQAGSILNAIAPDFMTGDTAELRGDIARAKGDLEGAREAYTRALAVQGDAQAEVRMKLLEIGIRGKSS